jgi:aspartate aminotransferase
MFRDIESSNTLVVNEKSKYLESRGKVVYKFGFGESPFHTPSWVVDKLRLNANANSYSSVQGDISLRESVASFHKEFFGTDHHADDIIIGPGSKILMYNLLSVLKACDVLLPVPGWNSYARQANFLEHNVIQIKSSYEDRWRINFDNISLALTKKIHENTVMFLNFPGNPDGLNYSDEELISIAALARKSDITVVSDEIYGLLSFDKKYRTFYEFYPEKTITLTGLSKWCGSGGWRIGACFLPTNSRYKEQLKKNLLAIASQTYACASTPIQIASAEAYKCTARARTFIDKQTVILKEISNFCYTTLVEAGVKLHLPEGAFYLFPDFTNFTERFLKANIFTSTDLCVRILEETNVMLIPGIDFGLPGSYYAARLAYVDFKYEADNSSEFDMNLHAPKIIKGIKDLADWLTKLHG